MKKLGFMIMAVGLLAASVIISCNRKSNEFSCDEKANNFAALHREGNQTISRDSLVTYDRTTQFAIWRSLSSENKKRIFNEKIDLVIANENLSQAEINHLNSLKNYYDVDLYEGGENTFLSDWQNYAINTLGWDQNKLTLYVGIWATQNELVTTAAIGGAATPTQDCTCKWDAGCAGFGDCSSSRGGGCTSKRGCGLIGTSNCDGTCPEDVRPSTSGSTH